MSWTANTGQWNPGIAITPDNMNMGSYTPDQWTAMQQQNWQQWAQWQQQFAQWQSQYGEKYAEQIQAMQSIGGAGGMIGAMPPLPASGPPPAPPPPDNPPPPAPHENNQPLFQKTTAQPSPVPPPGRNNLAPYNNATGNNQNWSYERDQQQSQQSVNAEALKKLAEEERLFDIQFQKWEVEIEKWRRENVNHPDKQAYKEYEAKFESCRQQLLERRAQMNQKRAKLLSGATPAAANAAVNTARDFIEPVHMFDYNHQSKDGETKKRDFEKEVDEMFGRKPRNDDFDRYSRDRDYYRPPEREDDRYSRDLSRQFERRAPRDDRDDYRPRVPPRDDYNDRRYLDNRLPENNRFDDRRRDERDFRNHDERDNRNRDERDRNRDDRDRNRRDDPYKDRERDSFRDRERDRDRGRDNRDRNRETRRSRSHERDNRKRARSKESPISIISDGSIHSKKSKDFDDKNPRQHIVMIDDILEPPGRDMRPAKIVIILRGPPGSGKSYLAKLIRDREAEYGGTARIMSIDDYFMQEGEMEETDPATGKIVKKPSLKYEYDSKLEETYVNSLKRAFKRSCTDGYFSFLIYDAVNDHLRCYADIWNYARQNGFQAYVCTMELDASVCHKRNIHNRSLEDIEVISARFFPTPPHHIQLDPTTLLQSAAITEVHMEDVDDDDVIMEDVQDEVETVFTSKWEKMDDADKLARLDGTSKPLRPSQLSMEDYLQLDDWQPSKSQPGKKSVRWADIEERRQQEKMRAIGFVVGQTDWNRMTDPTMGSSALTQTKYIERVRRT
ncbi:YLP motif-containing protein 1-like isoform X4 [Plodia interpunctella]|uniref:YLP motif-containing protein 1-like isoform X4 n=1 Tax=Plodia interpunctella TaxID=58824 RepID=UPI0023681CA5|nr:YLP motif-containing protein 1-like isoform X4 [Plodia interpunctella]